MSDKPNEKRRDFLQLSTITLGAVGTAAFMWPFLKSMNPAEDTLALGSTEVDISGIEEGQSITVKWRGKPVFIKRRTQLEIKEAMEEANNESELSIELSEEGVCIKSDTVGGLEALSKELGN